MLCFGTPDLPNTNNEAINKTIINSDVDAYNISSQVKAESIEFGFTLFKANLIALAASEMMINAIRYACNATIEINQTQNKKGLIIKIADEGSGITDLNSAIRPGFSTQNSLGLGLDAANRAVDEMYINTSKHGTHIYLIIYLPIKGIDFSSVSFSEVGKYFNRDGFNILQYHGENLLVALFDCHEVELKVSKVNLLLQNLIKTHYKMPLDELIKKAHHVLKENNLIEGTDLALLRITQNESQSIILGDINIHQLHLTDSYFSCVKLDAAIGKFIPNNLPITTTALTHPFCFAIFSNGIKSANLKNNPYQLFNAKKYAEKIFDTHAVTDNDATILVVKSYE